MTVLSPPRHPLITAALDDARRWCAGQAIDDRPALAHAARVAVVLGEHVPAADPWLVAAVLLHDAPEFAPTGLDLDTCLIERYGIEVVRVVRARRSGDPRAFFAARPGLLRSLPHFRESVRAGVGVVPTGMSATSTRCSPP